MKSWFVHGIYHVSKSFCTPGPGVYESLDSQDILECTGISKFLSLDYGDFFM